MAKLLVRDNRLVIRDAKLALDSCFDDCCVGDKFSCYRPLNNDISNVEVSFNCSFERKFYRCCPTQNTSPLHQRFFGTLDVLVSGVSQINEGCQFLSGFISTEAGTFTQVVNNQCLNPPITEEGINQVTANLIVSCPSCTGEPEDADPNTPFVSIGFATVTAGGGSAVLRFTIEDGAVVVELPPFFPSPVGALEFSFDGSLTLLDNSITVTSVLHMVRADESACFPRPSQEYDFTMIAQMTGLERFNP